MSEANVHGLKTPALSQNGATYPAPEPVEADEPKKQTALQVAQSLEAKVHELTASMEKDEKALATKLSKMSEQIDELIGQINA